MHIACLVMALLYKFAPEFLKEGRLYWLHAPLFKVTKGKTTKYFYSEEELNRSPLSGTQLRFKGLGEMYVADDRFRKNIDRHGEGTAEFVSACIKSYCK